jgi:hypothetical protein
MNRQNRFVVLLSMLVVLALLAACGAPQPTATMAPTSEPPVVPTDTPPAAADANARITVTFEGDQCVFHSPERVPAGRISIVLDVRDQTAHELYGVQALTMDQGHTLEELVPYQQEIRFPLWVHDHGFSKAAQGTTQERTIVLFEGPLFLSCFTNTADETQTEYAGMLGPVQVVNLVTNAEALAGVWHRTTPDSLGGEVYRKYTADGTYRMGHSPEELETQPLVEGEFWFEGNQLVMRDVAALPSYGSCLQPEQVGRYAVERMVNGQIRFVEVEDECRDRARMLGTGEMELVVNFPTGRFAARDGGWVLTLDDDGSFIFSESGTVAASGTFSIQGSELTWETDSYCGNAASMKATYTWTFENDTLLFQVKGKDNCADRLAVLDKIPYHKEE